MLGWEIAHLGLGVVLLLLGASDDGIILVCVEQVGLVVADDAGRAGIHKGLDARLLASLDDGLGAADIDLAEQLMGGLALAAGHGRRRVDDDVGLDGLQQLGQLGNVGDVALVVGGLFIDVVGASQIDRGHGLGVPRGQRLVDDVVAQEAVAADDEHVAEVASRSAGHCCEWLRVQRAEERADWGRGRGGMNGRWRTANTA